jgi:hypothetical protein
VRPLLVGSRDVATPESRFDLAQQMLPYLLLLLAFIGGMQLAIDATAGERERHTRTAAGDACHAGPSSAARSSPLRPSLLSLS